MPPKGFTGNRACAVPGTQDKILRTVAAFAAESCHDLFVISAKS